MAARVACLAFLAMNAGLASAQDASPKKNPQWKILVLLYTETDFRWTEGDTEHHFVASMTPEDIARAAVWLPCPTHVA